MISRGTVGSGISGPTVIAPPPATNQAAYYHQVAQETAPNAAVVARAPVPVPSPATSGPLGVLGQIGSVLVGAARDAGASIRAGASAAGTLLRTSESAAVRSIAAGTLRPLGTLAKSDLVRTVNDLTPEALVTSVALNVGSDVAAGDSWQRTVLNTSGLVLLGAAGGLAGGFACVTDTAATILGAFACPVLIVGGSAAGAEGGRDFGNWLADRAGW